MSPAQEQFARLKRYLARMERKAASDEGTDDMYSFFLHAWHLVDWASNDPAVNRTYGEVLADTSNSIRSCKDIANRSKHLVLDRPPRSAPETFKDYRVYCGNEANERQSEVSFRVTFPDGTTKDALTLAREVVADWESLLTRYGLSISSAP